MAAEKHAATKRRAWRNLHIGIDAHGGEIVAFDLTDKDNDDAAHLGPMLDQIGPASASFMGDGTCDSLAVYDAVTTSNPHIKVIVPLSGDAMPGPYVAISPDPAKAACTGYPSPWQGDLAMQLQLHRAVKG